MTLTEAVAVTKRSTLVLAVFLAVYLVAQEVWSPLKNIMFPPRVPPPEVAFGKLPSLEVGSLPLKEGAKPQYTVDTTTGRLPTDLPDRAKVYKVILPPPTHLTGERAKELASKLGFPTEPKKTSSAEYFWEDTEAGKKLRMNITTGSFYLETDIKKLSDPALGSPPAKASAPEQAKRFLSDLNLLSSDYREGRQEATYLRIEGDSLRKVESLSEAQMTRVDFFREIDKQPILGPKPLEGLISVVLGKDKVPFVFYSPWPLDPAQSSTYPLKTLKQVWEEVGAGQVRIVFLSPPSADPFASYEPKDPQTIFVRRIFLAYFDSDKLQSYLQPVYVLEGVGVGSDKKQLKYIAYVPAVVPSWAEGKE